ncbi:hypothetical protein [Nocardia sp. AG03]|uniref:hypothetical protein n=1 Tax=Nocardia sp. AG03 TaxID=3025312 RepID=UPI0024182531|nr:hypothetical protein [Nocardia sp. AG03]
MRTGAKRALIRKQAQWCRRISVTPGAIDAPLFRYRRGKGGTEFAGEKKRPAP